MWDGSLTKLSFAAIEKRLSDRFIDDQTLRQDSHSPTPPLSTKKTYLLGSLLQDYSSILMRALDVN